MNENPSHESKALLTYPYRVGLALDRLCNVLFANGDPDVTISERAGIARKNGERWGCYFCKYFLNPLIFILTLGKIKDHCQKAIE